MQHQRRDFLRLGVAVAALAVLTACGEKGNAGLVPGERFPELGLPDLEGRRVVLASGQGPALVVNFWATWCEPCRREMPSLQALSGLFSEDQLKVVGISVDEDLNLVREFQLRHRIGFQLLADQDQAAARDLALVPVYPMTYLVTREGIVAAAVAGERNWTEEAMLRTIEQALDVRRQQPGS